MSADRAVREVLPRIASLRRLVEGARVLELGGLSRTEGRSADWLAMVGARAVVSLDEDAAAVQAARRRIASAKIRFVHGTMDELPPGPFDLIWLHHQRPLPSLSDWAARLEGAFLILGVSAEELGGEAGYRALLEELAESFPSVEVATQRSLSAEVLSFGGEGPLPLYAEPGFEPPPTATAYLFVCGPRPCGLSGQWIVSLPPEDEGEALRRALSEKAELEEKLAEAEARIRALEARESPAAKDREIAALERRLEELRKREREALRHARDLEERAGEVRSESGRSSRAEVMASLRLQRFRAERARRKEKPEFDAAERERLLEVWRRRALEAERRVEILGSRTREG